MKQTILLSLAMSLLLFSCGNSKDFSKDEPKFEDFESSWCNTSIASARPDLSSTDLTVEQKKDLYEKWLTESGFFNCDQFILTVECGIDCQTNFILNSVSGKLIGTLNSKNGITFHKESALIVVNSTSDTNSNKEYWTIKDSQLLRIK